MAQWGEVIAPLLVQLVQNVPQTKEVFEPLLEGEEK